jgi:hypothetical protein
VNADEFAVRELLLAAAEQPALLSTRQVLAEGRRRRRRRQLGAVLGIVLVAALAGGGVVTQLRQPDSRHVIASVPVVPGEIVKLDVADLTFGVAARHSRTDRDLFLVVYLPDGAGGWGEVFGGGSMDQPPGPSIFAGNTQFPRVNFATLPAGSTSIRAVFSTGTDYVINAVPVRGIDGQPYVVVAVVTPTAADAGRLRGLTWVDDQGQPQEYLPLSG